MVSVNPPSLEEKEIRLADLALARAIWPLIRPFAWMLALSTVMSLGVTFFELIIPILIQKALDGFILITGESPGVRILGMEILSFKTFALVFAALISFGFIVFFVQTLFMEYTGQRIILKLRCTLFSHMTRLPVSYFDKNASGRLVSRVAGDIENMSEMFTSVLVFIAKDAALIIGTLVLMVHINPHLSLFLSWMIPVILVAVVLFSKASRKAFRTIRQKIGEINHSFSEGITGIKVIQTTAGQDAFVQRFKTLNLAHFTAAMFQIRIFALFMPFLGFLGVASTAVIIWSGSFSVMNLSMTLGELVAFLTYMKLFFRPLRELSETFNLLQNALASAERIVSVLNTPQVPDKKSLPSLKKMKSTDRIHTVQFKDVDFSYEKNTQVLKKISFSLDHGRSIGIAGQTGSGKSSIINLLTGFYTADKGQILINGTPLDRMDIREVRNRTALVMQDPILFSGSLRDNIRPWGSELTDADLEPALEKAGCDFLFEKFNGLSTQLLEGGRPLSSGEKQLVCIARAFAFDPDLIIFDEATSYMDSRSEQAIHQAMEKLMQNRLSIIIAHRLSTIKNCDNILLLREGQIREQGSHRELADLGGEYFHLLQKEKM